MGHDINGICSDDRLHLGGDLLFTGNASGHDHGRVGKGPALHGPQIGCLFHPPCRAARADDLPVPQVGLFTQDRIESAEQQRHEEHRSSAHDLFGEKIDAEGVRLEGLSQNLSLGLEGLVVLIHGFTQDTPDPIQHGLGLQCPCLAGIRPLCQVFPVSQAQVQFFLMAGEQQVFPDQADKGNEVAGT